MWSPRIDMCPPCKNHWMENSSIQRWDKKERRLWTQAGNSNLHSKSRVYQLADDSFTVDLISEAYICWLQKSYAHAENPIALFCWVSKLKAPYHYNTVDIRYQDNTVVSRNAWHALFFPLKIRSFHMTMHDQNLEAVLLDSWWPILIFTTVESGSVTSDLRLSTAVAKNRCWKLLSSSSTGATIASCNAEIGKASSGNLGSLMPR